MLGHSECFWEKMANMDEFGNSLKFDYTDYSWASVKLFLDCLHLIPTGPVDLATLLEVVGFCQFEGKTTYDSFEVDLVKRIMTSVMKTSLPLGTELLISAYLAKVDDFTDVYQQKVASKITKEAVSNLLFEFNMNSALNKRLIAMSGSDSAPEPIPHPKPKNRFRTQTDSAPEDFSLFSGAESVRVRNRMGAESDKLRMRNRKFEYQKV